MYIVLLYTVSLSHIKPHWWHVGQTRNEAASRRETFTTYNIRKINVISICGI